MSSPWFQSFDPVIAGSDAMRPLSLGSLEAMRVMGIDWLQEDAPVMDLAEEQRQILLFDWLHRAPLVEVEHALWSGDWRKLASAEVPDIIIARYRLLRARMMAEIREATVVLRAKPDDAKHAAQIPAEVVRPRALDYRLWLLMRDLHLSRTEALWHLPLAQAFVCYHCAMWSAGQWTVKPGKPVNEEEFEEGIELSDDEEPDIDTTSES